MIKPLTSFRFIFALLVFLHHLIFIIDKSNSSLLKFYHTYLEEGYLGVGFFFILSGYILSHVYSSALSDKNFNTIQFYINRIARIYPMHLLTLIIAIPLSLKLLDSSVWEWISRFFENMFLLQSFIPIRSHYFSFNMVSWSISNELFFYLLFPFLLKFITKLNNKKIYIFTGFICISILVSMFAIKDAYHHFLFYINPFVRLADFIVGIIIYQLFHNWEVTNTKKSTQLEILSVITLSFFYFISFLIPQVLRLSIFYWLPISFMIIVFSKSKGKLSSFLSKGIFITLGEISFGFYLYHLLVIRFVNYFNNRLNIIQHDLILVAIVFAISIAVSYFSYYLFETKAKQWVKKALIPSQHSTDFEAIKKHSKNIS